MLFNNKDSEPLNKSINMIYESFNLIKSEYETIINQLNDKLSQKDYQINALKEKNIKYKNKIQYLLKRLKAITSTVKDIEVESEEEFEQNNNTYNQKCDFKTASNSFAPVIKKNSINSFNINNIKKSEFNLQKSKINTSRNVNCNDIALNIISKTGCEHDDFTDFKKLDIKKNNRVLKNSSRLIKGKINSFNVNSEVNSHSHPKNTKNKKNRNFGNLLDDEYFKFNTEMSDSAKFNANFFSEQEGHTSFNVNETEGSKTERSNRDYS